MGMGGAVLLLTTLEYAEEHAIEPLAELAGWAETSDAYHDTAPSGWSGTLWVENRETVRGAGSEMCGMAAGFRSGQTHSIGLGFEAVHSCMP